MDREQRIQTLCGAAKAGDLEKVRDCLAKGVDINIGDWYGDTPLHSVAIYGHLNIVKLLLERADIDPNKENEYTGDTPLHAAASGGFISIVKLLLERSDIDPNKENKYSDTPLHSAVKGKHLNTVQLLLERTEIDPNKDNSFGYTPLHSAVRCGHLKIVELLLERTDIDPNKENKDGDTPLHSAAKGGHLNILQLLLERTEIDLNSENKSGYTPLQCSVKGGHIGIVQLLLGRTDIDSNKVNKHGYTPLHSAVSGKQINIVQLLLERTDIDPNKDNRINGDTPLHTAVRRQNLSMVQLLLERRDIEQDKVNKINGDTPLHTAVRGQNLSMVQLLLERGDIDPDKVNKINGDTSLHTAVRGQNLSMVQLLLERGDIDPDKVNKMNGNTPLHTAVRDQNLEMVQLLLERGDINPDKVNKISGDTPLHTAVRGQNRRMVQLLLERGDIDPDKVNKMNGDTPLHTAVRDQNLEMVQLLLERGDTNPDKVNKHNETPMDVFKAREGRMEEDNKIKRAIEELFKFHALGLPAEIRALDKNSAKVFTHLLEEESYPHFESRVMLAGEQGTGKTTIARYLIGKGPTEVRKSTDGIGLYTGLSYIDREKEEWLDGKQDFSLAELTISRSLRQKPSDTPTSSLSTGLSTDLSKQCGESLMSGAAVRFNEQHVVFRERNEMQGVPVETEKDNSRSREQRVWNNPTQSIADNRPITNILLDLHKPQGDLNNERTVAKVHLSPDELRGHPPDEIPVQNVHLDLQKQQDHPLDEKPVLNVPLDLDKTKCNSKDERLVPCVSFDLHKQQGNQKMLVQNVPLDLIKQQDYPQDKKPGPKVLLDIDKQQVHPLDKRPNVQFDSKTPSRKFRKNPFFLHEQKGDYHDNRAIPNIFFTKENQKQDLQGDVPQHRDPYTSRSMACNPIISSGQPNYSDEDTQCTEFEDVIKDIPVPVNQTYVKAALENESQKYKPNPGSPVVLGDSNHSSFQGDLSMHVSKEQMKTLTKLSEVEQATSGLTHSVESVTNPRLITKLKRFFGVSKEVKEIKVSITEEHILRQSLKVGKKKLHQRNIAPVIIWDFGGQDIFYSTHQSFLSYRAIYLIVLDGSRTLDHPCPFEQYLPGKSGPKTARDYLRFWTNTVVTYCKGSQHGFPKIVIVFTHKDKLKPSEVETAREQLFGDVKSMFHGSPLGSHLVIEDKIFVNARNKNDPEMAKIKQTIIRESTRQPTWGQNLPKCFIPLELEFENLIRKGINVITFDDLRKINTEHPIRPLTDAELKVFLKFQHAIGKILYFDEPGLNQHVTLLPTYLIDAFKSIITDKSFCKGEKRREDLWNLMSQKGVISKFAIEELWRYRKYRRFEQRKDYLLAVMTHLDILVEPKRYDPKHNRIPADFYYVASMVQAKDATGYIQSPSFSERNIAISFNSNAAIIPPALSFRFITYCLSIFDVKKYGERNEDMLFHRSAVFTIDSSLDIHILCEDERIFVRLVHAKKKVLIMRDLASSICECLKSALQNISQLYIKTSSDTFDVNTGSFELNLCCSDAESPCFLPLDKFDSIDSIWICPKHNMEHERFVLSLWIKEKETGIKCEVNCPVTNEEFLSEVPSALHLRRLSILYDLDDIREMVIYLGLPYVVWSDLYQLESEPELLKFKALCRCHKKSPLTFRKIKKAIEKWRIQTPHILCEVMKGDSVDFETDPEKWDLVPTDEDIDKMAPLIGNKSLLFLVELGMDLDIWATINYRQVKRDLVQLNRDILNEWKNTFCTAHNMKPTLRMIAQAYKHIGNDVKVIENTLFN